MNHTRLGDQQQFRDLVDELPGIAIWVVDDVDSFAYISAGFEELWGRSPEVLKTDPSKLLDFVHEDDRELVREYMHRDPETITTEGYEARIRRPDGTVRWIEVTQVPVRTDGELTEVIGMSIDITDRKRRERNLTALNRLLRHDIRNDASVILGWAELLETRFDEPPNELENIIGAAEQIHAVTGQVGEHAQLIEDAAETTIEPTSLTGTLETVVMTRREVHPGAMIDLEDDLPAVEVPANPFLNSIFRNLIDNAIQHNDTDEPMVSIDVKVEDDGVIVHVADNGPGIPADHRDEIFEAGVSGSDNGGTGFGLHLVKQLVEQYDGSISVSDNDPRGSVFTVSLPLVSD